MPDLGIGEAIAGISALIGEGASAAGGALAAGAEGLGGAALAGAEGLGGALAGGLGGLGDAVGGAASGLGDLLGTGGAAAGDTAAGLGAAAPTAAAGGLAPAAAGPVDIASTLGAGSSLGGDVTAFAPTTTGIADQAGGIFGGIQGIPTTDFTGGLVGTADQGFSAAEVGGFSPAGSLGYGGTADAATAGFGGTGDLASLTGAGPAAGGTGDIASLAGGAGGGAAGPAGVTGGTVAGLPAAGGAPATGGSFLDSLTTGAVNSITKNPLGIGLGAAGLGYNIIEGQKNTANVNAVTNAAGAEAAQGAQLQTYLQNGTLPPGLQASVDNATKAAKAKIISGYASRGQNANPAQNSALAQELNDVDMKAVEAQGQLATGLLTAGINETNMSNQLYEFLVGVDQKQAQLTGQAIANFASAMAGGPKTIQIGGTTAG